MIIALVVLSKRTFVLLTASTVSMTCKIIQSSQTWRSSHVQSYTVGLVHLYSVCKRTALHSGITSIAGSHDLFVVRYRKLIM